ncbi:MULTISPECIES: efflux RND transporter periplasmic adaptor subunit [unclassified Nostoc]|uniref:efflux RND transporter periplasmic adaptor subunit n=1 Tax=unclassified Nostoc TaxID=2593658 RepID=UPI001D4087FB|nr:efflux RND transporter periplasmic adaptor subunit [Nostoc sp. JL23]MBN3874891.1 efflux RND transporter periplasmic adaptor subunit [Nostoc sp. JL23]
MSSISLNFKKGVDSAKQKLHNRFKTNKWLMGLLVAIPLAGGLSYLVYNQLVTVAKQQAQSKIQTAAVTRGNLTILVSANGTVQPESSVNISPKTSGVLKQLLVKEGDFVKPGQIVAYMDNSNIQGQLLQARGNLAAAQANLNKVIAGNRSQDIAGSTANLNKVQATYRQAAEDLRRNQKLQAQGAISQQVLSLARSTSDSAQAQVEQSQQALNLLKAGSRPEDIAQARAQVMAAQGAVTIAQRNIDDTVIRAPFAGIIARKYADPGAFVTPTTAGSAVTSATSSSILALASTNEIVAQVAEASIAQIRVGQVAVIKVDAYSGKTFEGKVTQVATQSLVQQNVTSFEVKVAVADPQKLLSQGMNVTIDFKAGELNQVLVVPTAAIVQQKASQGVYVAKTGGDPVFMPIVVGTTVNDKTEVKSGLTGNERVLLSFPPGTRKVTPITGGG